MNDGGLRPPVAERRPVVVVRHGERFEDPYAWLREDAAVRAYLEAENAYAEAVPGADQGAAGAALPGDARPHQADRPDGAVPRRGGYCYYSRTEEGKQYPIHCRKQGSLEAPEEVLLDLNALAEGQEFMALGACAVSDDGTCWPTPPTTTGYREYTLQVKDLRPGRMLPLRIEQRAARWPGRPTAARCSTRSRTTRQAAVRLYRHVLGADGSARPGLRGGGRALPGRRRPHPEPRRTCCSYASSHTTSGGALPARRRARRASGRLFAPREEEQRVRRRSPGRPLHRPHQRHRPQLPGRARAGRGPGARSAGGAGCRTATT